MGTAQVLEWVPSSLYIHISTEMSLHNDDRSLSCNSIVLLDSFDV